MVLPKRNASNVSIHSVEKLIDMMFVDDDKRCAKVDFAIIHAILLVLCRGLNILERDMIFSCDRYQRLISKQERNNEKTITIRELKVHTKMLHSEKHTGYDDYEDRKGRAYKRKERGARKRPDDIYDGEEESEGRSGDDDHGKRQKSGKKRTKKMGNKGTGVQSGHDDGDDDYDKGKKVVKTRTQKRGKKGTRVQSGDDDDYGKGGRPSKEGGGYDDDYGKGKKVVKKRTQRRGKKETGVQSGDDDDYGKGKKSGKKRTVKSGYDDDDDTERKLGKLRSGAQGSYEHDEGSRSSLVKQKRVKKAESEEYAKDKIYVVEEKASEDKVGQKEYDLVSLVTKKSFEKLRLEVMDLEERFGTKDIPMNYTMLSQQYLGNPTSIIQISQRLENVESIIYNLTEVLGDVAKYLSKIKEFKSMEMLDIGPLTSIIADPDRSLGDTVENVYNISKIITEDDIEEEIRMRTEEIEDEETEDLGDEPGKHLTKEVLGAYTKIFHAEILKIFTPRILKARMELQHIYRDSQNYGLKIKVNPDLYVSMDALEDLMIQLQCSLTVSLKIKVNPDLYVSMDALEDLMIQLIADHHNKDQIATRITDEFREDLQQMQEILDEAEERIYEKIANLPSVENEVSLVLKTVEDFKYTHNVTVDSQADLDKFLKRMCKDLKELLTWIVELDRVKAERSEVTQALNAKIGLREINGFVDVPYYNATISDIDETLKTQIQKYDTQEHVWENLIKELWGVFQNKASMDKITKFKEDVLNKTAYLRKRVDFLIGNQEPCLDLEEKLLLLENPCLSCGNDQSQYVVRGEIRRQKNTSFDKKICYPGVTPCSRYCYCNEIESARVQEVNPFMTIHKIQLGERQVNQKRRLPPLSPSVHHPYKNGVIEF